MKTKKTLFLDKLSNTLEVVIAVILLIIIATQVVQLTLNVIGFDITILYLDFQTLLSTTLTLVIGVEFVKMLYRHTYDSVVNVLLFAIARLMIIDYESTIDVLIGVVAIAILFAAKKFLIDSKTDIE